VHFFISSLFSLNRESMDHPQEQRADVPKYVVVDCGMILCEPLAIHGGQWREISDDNDISK
jgi:hypothetical protein